MKSAQIDVKEYRYFAGNEWREAADKKFFEVHEPYSGQLFARVAAGSRADARAAVDAAAKAFPAWADSAPAERARLFLKASEIVRRRRTEIAEMLARETGSTISFSTFQMDLVAATLQQVAGWVYLPKGEVLETNQPGTHSIGVRRPLGVCASFDPIITRDAITLIDDRVKDALARGATAHTGAKRDGQIYYPTILTDV